MQRPGTSLAFSGTVTCRKKVLLHSTSERVKVTMERVCYAYCSTGSIWRQGSYIWSRHENGIYTPPHSITPHLQRRVVQNTYPRAHGVNSVHFVQLFEQSRPPHAHGVNPIFNVLLATTNQHYELTFLPRPCRCPAHILPEGRHDLGAVRAPACDGPRARYRDDLRPA